MNRIKIFLKYIYNIRSKIFGIFFIIFFFSCSESPNTKPLPVGTPSMSVCESAHVKIGNRIRLYGLFEGFGYGAKSKLITIESGELCNDRGAGVVFATLSDDNERKKLFTTKPGTKIYIEGKVDKIKEFRFIYLSEVIVIN